MRTPREAGGDPQPGAVRRVGGGAGPGTPLGAALPASPRGGHAEAPRSEGARKQAAPLPAADGRSRAVAALAAAAAAPALGAPGPGSAGPG